MVRNTPIIPAVLLCISREEVALVEGVAPGAGVVAYCLRIDNI